MDPDSLWEIALLLFLIAGSAFFAASEIAIITFRKAKLRQLVKEGVKAAEVVERLAEDSSRFLATIQLGVTLIGFFAAATAAVNLSDDVARIIAQVPVAFVAGASQPIAVVIVTVFVAFFMLLLGELVPKTLGLQYPERIALFAARPLNLLATMAAPLVGFLTLTTNAVASLFGSRQQAGMPFVTEEEILTMVDAGQEEGVLEEEEKEMIASIFELGKTAVREVMVPRIDIVAVPVETAFLEALDLILSKGHSRIPVYEGTIDNVVGLLYAKDLLRYLRDGQSDVELSKILRPAHFVPESKKVDDLLKELQQRKVHMAIVVDEYGGTAGLATIEDLLEEIVGEIEDEYDREEPFAEVISENEAIFNARIDIDDVNDMMSLDLPVDESDTLGGLIYTQLGKVPAAGDEVRLDGVKILVLSVAGRRIKKVRLVKEVAGPGEGAKGDDH